ncbi:MAG: hypothetical protein IK041_01595 [Bacteroidales bacterium]|nr:hypothetical protein [Bacteroidales bacterium]
MEKTRINKKRKSNSFSTFYKYLQGLENYAKDYAEDLKESIVCEFSGGRTSSLKTIYEDYPHEYFKMMEWMKSQQKPSAYSNEGEKWRRRVLAAICSYLDAAGRRFDEKSKKISYAMTIACRSANCKSFNKISITALRKVYNTFGFLKKDLAALDSKGYMGTTVKDWQEAVNNVLRANNIKQAESNN